MTKVTFIGQEPTKESKHIELVETYLHSNVAVSAEDWGNCQLVKRNAHKGMDLIFCYDDTGDVLYLGNWNDGTTSNPETVCTVLDANPKGKPIEFVKQVNTDEADARVTKVPQSPKHYDNILVVRHGKEGFFDLFIAYHGEINPLFTNTDEQHIFLGHLNDGFVE
jgi:hypothetical protein